MKRVLYLAIAALVALMLAMPGAMADQHEVVEMQKEVKMEAEVTPLPKAGGPVPVSAFVLPAAALLIGSGVLVYAVLRRR